MSTTHGFFPGDESTGFAQTHDPGRVRLRVDDAPPGCTETTHVWAVGFAFGDACRCGARVLLNAPDGLTVEDREP